MPRRLLYPKYGIPYPGHCNPRVLFSKMAFWVGFNSKKSSKSVLFCQKVGFYSRKTPKNFTLHGGQFKSGAALMRIRYIDSISTNILHCCKSLNSVHLCLKNTLLRTEQADIRACSVFGTPLQLIKFPTLPNLSKIKRWIANQKSRTSI